MDLIISFDIKSDFGFFKKPDSNEKAGIYLTYNIIHKPALLGMLGAIIGLDGYRVAGELPGYYKELNDLQIAIQPLNSDKGNFKKTVIRYTNTVGYANRDGGTLIVDEQTLIKPSFRCYIKPDITNEKHFLISEYLEDTIAEYLPYLGKNDFSLWWENFKAYEAEPFEFNREYVISTIFNKNDHLIKDSKAELSFDIMDDLPTETKYMYFERLPVSFHPELKQYEFEEFVYTNFKLSKETKLENLYQLKENNEIIQLF